MIAITVNPDTYTRKNNDAAIAGSIVAMLCSTMQLRYKKEIKQFGLIEHYNFVGVPDKIWPFSNLFMPLQELLGIDIKRLLDLIQIKYYDDPE